MMRNHLQENCRPFKALQNIFVSKKCYIFENRQIGVDLGNLQTTDGAYYDDKPFARKLQATIKGHQPPLVLDD